MSYRGIPQYTQGFPQISQQAVMRGNPQTKIKRNPGNNVALQPVAISNPYIDITAQTQNIPTPQGATIHVGQPPPQQTTVQYYVQPPQQHLPQPPPSQYNRIPPNSPIYPQYMQPGFTYPIYQAKNNAIPIVSNMQPVSAIQSNAPDPSMIGQHQLQQSLVQPSQIQHIPPAPTPPTQSIQQLGHNPNHSQESIMYQTPYSKMAMDYVQMQQQKMGIRQPPIESKPVMPIQHPPPQQPQQMINFQQQAIQQQQQQQQQQFQQPQQKIESAMTIPVSPFVPDYNFPPAGPFNIIARGNLPSINFVYTTS